MYTVNAGAWQERMGGGGLPPFLSKIVEQLWKTKTDKYYIYMKVYTRFKLEDIL